jgi:hypothetical protein
VLIVLRSSVLRFLRRHASFESHIAPLNRFCFLNTRFALDQISV